MKVDPNNSEGMGAVTWAMTLLAAVLFLALYGCAAQPHISEQEAMVNWVTSTCEAYGFPAGSPQFADCALKAQSSYLMAKEQEARRRQRQIEFGSQLYRYGSTPRTY